MIINNMKKNILAINGSTRTDSSNLNLINAINEISSDYFNIILLNGIDQLPQFNPDLDNENPPKAIIDFRNSIKAADGVLICTPEYAMGVPGTLKNAIDWTVLSMEFSKKPVALITASSLGEKAHESLLGTLRVIEANIKEETQLLISYIKTKVSKCSKITDPATKEQVENLLINFNDLIKLNPHSISHKL